MMIAGRKVGRGSAPYLIAEMSGNHNGRIETALRLIEEAYRAGADAVKLQTYRPDTITLNSNDSDFQITEGPWAGHTLWDLYEWAHTPWEWHPEMFAHAKKLGITIFSSPFDSSAVDFLEDLNAPAYKVASFEAIDLPLIRYIASTGKPMIISTGMANANEIQEALDAAREAGCEQVALLHCVSGYPTPATDCNLRTIPDMIDRYETIIGLSDHTLDNFAAITSIGLGAAIVEKHLTLDRSSGGPDDSFSLQPDEFRQLCVGCRTAWEALGDIDYGRKSSEVDNVKFRRSLYFIRDLEAGERITRDAVRSVRPGFGIAPKFIDDIVGRRVAVDVRRHSAVRFEDVEGE